MSDETKAIQPQARPVTIAKNSGEYDIFLDTASFDQAYRAANLLSRTTVVPDHFKGKPENCFVVLSLAKQLKENVLTLMQKTYVVGGKMGLESQIIIGLVNTRGPFSTPISYETKVDENGKIKSCTAFASLRSTGERCEFTLTAEMVEKEGWAKKTGSKWVTLPELMYRYRAAAFLARLYCPEVIMGLHTREELEDIRDRVEQKALPESDLNERLRKPVKSVTKEVVPEKPKPVEKEVPPSNIMPEERYYCDGCCREFGEKKNGLCPHCSSEKVIDRMGETETEI